MVSTILGVELGAQYGRGRSGREAKRTHRTDEWRASRGAPTPPQTLGSPAVGVRPSYKRGVPQAYGQKKGYAVEHRSVGPGGGDNSPAHHGRFVY